MQKVFETILSHLEQLTISGKDAERMAAIKSMVRDLIAITKEAPTKQNNEDILQNGDA